MDDYKSLKKGWIPLADLYKTYNKDKSNMNKLLKNLDTLHKEKLGRDWVVKESEFLKLLNID